jgi:flagellar assembly protein FliH
MLTSKFIRTAQVADAARWKFTSFGGETAANDLPETEAPRRTILSEDEKKLVSDAFQRGLAQGFNAGMEHARKEAQQRDTRLDSLLARLQSQFETMDSEVADQMVRFSFALAKQVIRRELETRPELVEAAVREALKELSTRATHPVILLNPEDLPLVRGELDEELKLRQCRVLPDAQIARGGCRIESGVGEIDATMESRWTRAIAAIGCPEEQT